MYTERYPESIGRVDQCIYFKLLSLLSKTKGRRSDLYKLISDNGLLYGC